MVISDEHLPRHYDSSIPVAQRTKSDETGILKAVGARHSCGGGDSEYSPSYFTSDANVSGNLRDILLSGKHEEPKEVGRQVTDRVYGPGEYHQVCTLSHSQPDIFLAERGPIVPEPIPMSHMTQAAGSPGHREPASFTSDDPAPRNSGSLQWSPESSSREVCGESTGKPPLLLHPRVDASFSEDGRPHALGQVGTGIIPSRLIV